jgi:hypothetical protein
MLSYFLTLFFHSLFFHCNYLGIYRVDISTYISVGIYQWTYLVKKKSHTNKKHSSWFLFVFVNFLIVNGSHISWVEFDN